MRIIFLLSSAAALAVAMPALAQGQGGGHGRGDRDRGDREDRGDRGSHERREARDDDRGRDRDDVRSARGEREERREARDDARREERGEARREWREELREARRDERRSDEDYRPLREARIDRGRGQWRSERRGARVTAWRNGCPPGLARQNAYCMPPGQLRHAQALAYNIPDRYRYRFADDGRYFYRYDETGYVYRFAQGSRLFDRAIPLFANGLFVGDPLPLGYDAYNLPTSYRSYYPDTDDYAYRYDDGAIYRVNQGSGLIEGVVALLTGGVGGLGGLGAGDQLPRGYDAYNVPLDYRDRYADSDQNWYRYADGSIYQVDPRTRLIEQVISLIL